jgi:hypothetical protein
MRGWQGRGIGRRRITAGETQASRPSGRCVLPFSRTWARLATQLSVTAWVAMIRAFCGAFRAPVRTRAVRACRVLPAGAFGRTLNAPAAFAWP